MSRRWGGSPPSTSRQSDLVELASVDRAERDLAGLVAGLLWLVGGASLSTFTVLPGITHSHRVSLWVISALACLWGSCSMWVIRWHAAPWWLIHVSIASGYGAIAAAVASSGGAVSPAWIYIFFIVVFAAYFFPPRIAVAYLGVCVLVHALPLLYDDRAPHVVFVPYMVIASASYAALGAAIMAGKSLMVKLRARAEQLAAEQGSLRRVATAVVEGEPFERIYELVAFEAASLVGAGAAEIMRLAGQDRMIVMGSWCDHADSRYKPGTVIRIRPESDIAQALETKLPVRIDHHGPRTSVGRLGYSSTVVAPIPVAGHNWGVLTVTAAEPTSLGDPDEQRLKAFGDLLATAIASIEDRAKLAAQASTDPLTALANHRTVHQRLAADLAQIKSDGETLSVAVLDIDNFKQINDLGGHEAGDEVLSAVSRCLTKLTRPEDTLGRVGGDEFAWILPQTTCAEALVAVDRARRMIAATVRQPFRLSLSAGICDSSMADDPAELIRLADGALYWSKAHGRNQSRIYDPAVIDELSAQERAEKLERSQALIGLRALARAIDAKDPATRQHSERVAVLVGKLARAAGWPDEKAGLLSEAALVHDVGKIGIPDGILRKAGPLTAAEREQIRGHAELAARIVEGVLTDEQVDWIRTHHERPDGRGYPRGLRGDQIPEGGALLAVADAWDVMTIRRPDSINKSGEEALADCVALIDLQFSRKAVAALTTLQAGDELPPVHAQLGRLAGSTVR